MIMSVCSNVPTHPLASQKNNKSCINAGGWRKATPVMHFSTKGRARQSVVQIGADCMGRLHDVGARCLMLAAECLPLISAGVDFESKLLQPDGKHVKLQIWDTTGQDRYCSIASSCLQEAHAAMLSKWHRAEATSTRMHAAY